MDFNAALLAMEEGKRVARPSWNPVTDPPTPPNVWLEIRTPQRGSDNQLASVALKTADQTYVQWQAGNILGDIQATDWEEVPGLGESPEAMAERQAYEKKAKAEREAKGAPKKEDVKTK